MKLNEKSLEDAIRQIASLREKKLLHKPTYFLCFPHHVKTSLKILGWLKQPVKRVQGLRKRKRALYWRKTV